MKRSRPIVWIDDNDGRQATADDLEDDAQIRVRFVNVHNKVIEDELETVFDGEQPSLLILDHILDKTEEPSALFGKGSTIAGAAKAQWPACPVIGVTAAENEDEIDVRSRLSYDELYPINDFRRHMSAIPIIAKHFRFVASKNLTSTSQVMALLKAPTSDIERIDSSLPDEIKAKLNDRSLPSQLYSWVQAVLVKRPGFLYDHIWSATMLGLNLEAFGRLSARFERARYVGVFALPERMRWWASQLIELLFRSVEVRLGEPSWVAGRRLRGVRKIDHSRCFACGGELPETVAFEDETIDSRRHPMHLACTKPHSKYRKELYFEEIRVMAGV